MNICLSKEIRRLNHLISETNSAYHEAALKLGQSDSAMQILYDAYDGGGECLLRDICFWTGISKQTLNSAVRKLEREGMITLEPVGAKNKMVRLTASGILLAERTAAKVMEAENRVFSGWDRAEVEMYLELTKRYLTEFKQETCEF